MKTKEQRRESYLRNLGKCLNYSRSYRDKMTQEQRNEMAEYQKTYYRLNKERKLAVAREWRMKNKEKVIAYKKRYRLKNVDHIIEYRTQYDTDRRCKTSFLTTIAQTSLLAETINKNEELCQKKN